MSATMGTLINDRLGPLLSLIKKINLAQVTSLTCLVLVVLNGVSLYLAVILTLSLVVNVLTPWIPKHQNTQELKIKELEAELKLIRTEISKLNLIFGVSRGEAFRPRTEERV